MTPEKIQELRRLARRVGADLRIVPPGQGDDLTGQGVDVSPREINGVLSPPAYFNAAERLVTLEYDPDTMSPVAAEVTAMHEIGHAATLPKGGVALDLFEQMMWALGDTPRPIQEYEIRAWEWAAPRLRPELHAQARVQIPWALGTYDVGWKETAERVLTQLGVFVR